MPNKVILLLLLGIASLLAQAQCPPSYSQYLSINKARPLILNGSDQWWNTLDRGANTVPAVAPPAVGPSCSFTSALWIGGMDTSGVLHVAANTYRQSGVDFYTGPIRQGFPYDCEAEIITPSNLLKGLFTTLADGRIIMPRSEGFSLYEEATSTVTDIPFPGFAAASQCLQLQDGRIMCVMMDVSPIQYVVVMMDTLSFSPAVACTLTGSYAKGSLTLFSTGEVLIGTAAPQIFDPATLTCTPIAGAPSFNFARPLRFPSDSVLMVGGMLGGNCRWYDHATGAVTLGPALPASMFSPGAAHLPDGRFLLLADDTTTYYLHPTTLAFSPGPLRAEQMGATTDGLELPTGDFLFLSALGMELFHSGSGSFERLGLINSQQGAGLLPSGKVLLMHDANHCVTYDPDADTLVGNPYQHIWNLTRAQVNEFISDHASGTVDYAKYPGIQSWPAHGDIAQGEDRLLAPFVDLDADGIYNPSTGEYPCITGDQSLWYISHDDGPHGGSGAPNRMGVQMAYTCYGFAPGSTSCTDSFVDYTTFYHYEITNRSGQDYHDVYVGLWVDVSLGNYMDDYVGCDTTRDLGFAYNGDADDESADGYGANPPAFGIKLLRTPQHVGLSHFMHHYNSPDFTGYPQEYTDHYGFLKSEWRDSSQLVDNGTDGYPGSGAGPVTHYSYPGNAGWCGGASTGWSEVEAGSTPGARSMILSCGPLDLPADSTLRLDYAAIFARTLSGGHLASVCELQAASDAITNWWNGQDFECFHLAVGRDAAAPPAQGAILFPNPTAGQFTLQWPSPLTQDTPVAVMNAQGSVVSRHMAVKGSSQLLVDQRLATGIYLVQVQGNATFKLVVQ